MLTKIIKWIKSLKFNTKRFIYITAISIVEVILLLWGNGWKYTPAVYTVIVQYIMVFKKRVEELEENNIKLLIKGIIELAKDGKSVDDILEKIKED